MAIGASLLYNSALLLWLRGGFGHTFVAVVLATWVAIPVAVAAAVAYALSHVWPPLRRIGQRSAIVAAVLVSGVASLPPGRLVVDHDIVSAEQYCDRVASQLDAYRREHGAYPQELSAIVLPPGRPYLARSVLYGSNGSSFWFTLSDPRGIMNFIGFDSRERRWFLWH